MAFGGGTDSTALLAGWVERGLQAVEPIDVILFADTGGEKPHTYAHIERMNLWLALNGMPEITVVRKGGRVETLEQECLRLKTLPSIAFGYKTCSQKYKVEPQQKWANNDPVCKAAWAAGELVEQLVGYSFEEERRWANAGLEDDKFRYRFPLVEWEWRKEDSIAAIHRAGLPLPGKSACFFCPSSKKSEIFDLAVDYPDLYERAIAIEDGARPRLTQKVKGLGRRFAWRDYAAGFDVPEPDIAPCMVCVDGG